MKEGKLHQRAVRYIFQCKLEEFGGLNVNELASRMGVSVSHLSREFKSHRGIGLKKYLVCEKLIRIRFLLIQNQRLRIKDIAQIFDFNTCDYFNRIFKEHVGVSPGEYRDIYQGFYGLRDRRRRSLTDRRLKIHPCFKNSPESELKNFMVNIQERRVLTRRRRQAYTKQINYN